MKKTYKVYDLASGKMVFEGTTKECAAWFGVTDNAIRNAADRKCKFRGAYRVVDTTWLDDEEPVNRLSAAEEWDKFCEPIRKKYGIPVYKAKPEVRG